MSLSLYVHLDLHFENVTYHPFHGIWTEECSWCGSMQISYV